MVSFKENKICIWAGSSLREVTLMRDFHFVWRGRSLVIESGFRCDCASVPVWYAVMFLSLAIVGVLWYDVPNAHLIALGLIVVQAATLMLRKARLMPAGIVHDAAYAQKIMLWDAKEKLASKYMVTRSEADELFREIIIEYSMTRLPKVITVVPAWIAWVAVRAFGARHFKV